jgi:hypothetical protein
MSDNELRDTIVGVVEIIKDGILQSNVSTDSTELESKKYEIKIDMKLYTDSGEKSKIFFLGKPKIDIQLLNDLTNLKQYKSFDNLESLTDNFFERIKQQEYGELKDIKTFRRSYINTEKAGGSTPNEVTKYFQLLINYDIVIKLQKSKGKTIIQEYLLLIRDFKTDDQLAAQPTGLLDSKKENFEVKITLPENNTSIFASKYQMYLPTEKQLLDELTKELRKLEL